MNKLALIGKSIKHSKSQDVYEGLLGQKIDYTLIDCENTDDLPELDELFLKYEGISITSPYKNYYFDKVIVEKDISQLKNINCLKYEDKKFYGTNTDYLAICEYLELLLAKFPDGLEVTLLGNGSMALVTSIALEYKKIPYKQLFRKKDGDLSRLDFEMLQQNGLKKSLIINSCSRDFIFKGKIGLNSIFWDYNYSFSPHEYLKEVCEYQDGLEMLKAQAKFALEFWKSK